MPISLMPSSPERSQEYLIDEQNTGEYDMLQVYSYEKGSLRLNIGGQYLSEQRESGFLVWHSSFSSCDTPPCVLQKSWIWLKSLHSTTSESSALCNILSEMFIYLLTFWVFISRFLSLLMMVAANVSAFIFSSPQWPCSFIWKE